MGPHPQAEEDPVLQHGVERAFDRGGRGFGHGGTVYHSVGRFDLSWPINKRQYLDFGYVKIDRSGSRVIARDIEWKDFVFQAGTEVTAGFNSNFPCAAWRYDFLQMEQVRISGSAGIDYLGLGVSLMANGMVTDLNGVPITGSVDEKVNIAFPVPQLGLQLDWALTKRLEVKGPSFYFNFAF